MSIMRKKEEEDPAASETLWHDGGDNDVGNCDGGDGDDGEEEDPIGSARNKKVERFSRNWGDDDDDHWPWLIMMMSMTIMMMIR